MDVNFNYLTCDNSEKSVSLLPYQTLEQLPLAKSVCLEKWFKLMIAQCYLGSTIIYQRILSHL